MEAKTNKTCTDHFVVSPSQVQMAKFPHKVDTVSLLGLILASQTGTGKLAHQYVRASNLI